MRVYGIMMHFVKVYKSIRSYMEVYEGIWRYMEVYGGNLNGDTRKYMGVYASM